MFKSLIITLCLFLSFAVNSLSSEHPFRQSAQQIETTIENPTDGWVLEFFDGSWWWVLYDTDGKRIHTIPADL